MTESNRLTALKTSALRLTSTKGELEDLNEDAEGAAESITQLQTKLLNLTKGNVNIMASPDEFKSTYEILQDMSKVWDTMTQKDQMSALELMFGKRAANVGSAIITNFQDAEKVMETVSDSTGSATEENQKFLESINGKINKLKASFESLSNSVIGSGVVKTVVDGANLIVTGLDKMITAFGSLPVLIMAATTALSLFMNKGLFTGNSDMDKKGIAWSMFGLSGGRKAQSNQDANIFNSIALGLQSGDIEVGKFQEHLAGCSKEAKMLATNIGNTTQDVSSQADAFSKHALTVDADTKAIRSATVASKLMSTALNIGISALISVAVWGIDYLLNYSDKMAEKAEKTRQELSKTTEELTKLQDESKTTSDRINELQNKGSLTLIEQDELTKLKQTNAQLKTQIETTRQLQAIQEEQSQRDSAKAAKSGNADSWERRIYNYGSSSNGNLDEYYSTDIAYFESMLNSAEEGTDAFTKAEQGLKDEILQLKGNIGDNVYQTGNHLSEAQLAINEQIDTYIQANAKLAQVKGDTSLAISNLLSDGKFASIGKDILAGKEIDQESDAYKELIDVMEALKIPTEDLAAKYIELQNSSEGASDGANTLGESLSDVATEAKSLIDTLDTLAAKQDLIKNVAEQIQEFGNIDISNIDGIFDTFSNNDNVMSALKNYISGIGDAKTVLQEMKNVYEEDQQAYLNNILQKEYTDADFLKNVIENNVTLKNGLAELYNGDLTNYSNLAQAKLSLDTNLISVLGSNWSQYYKTQGQAIRAAIGLVKANLQVDGFRAIKGTDRTPEEIAADKKLLAELNSQVALADYYDNISKEMKTKLGNYTSVIDKNGSSFSSSSSSAKEDTTDYWKQAFDDELAALKHQEEMKYISEAEYFQRLEALNNKYFQGRSEYQSEYWQYEEEIFNGRMKLIDEAEQDINNLIDLRIEYIKKLKEEQKDAIDQEIKDKKQLIDLEKEAIQLKKDERDYEKELEEKKKSVSDIESELLSLSNDNSREAQRRKLELQEELTGKQSDLDEYVYDHEVDTKSDALDKEYEAYELEKQKEIDALEAYLNNEYQLRADAINQLNGMYQSTLDELIEYNRQFGDGIDENIVQKWQDAYNALKAYGDLNNITNSLNVINQQQAANNPSAGSGSSSSSSSGSASGNSGSVASSAGGLNVGDRVKTVGYGNGASDGSANRAKKGLSGRTIMRIKNGSKYPYLIGVNGTPTGWYTADALQRYHTGGIIGNGMSGVSQEFFKLMNLSKGEVPIIAQGGEGVVTAQNMKNFMTTTLPTMLNNANSSFGNITFGNVIIEGNATDDMLNKLKSVQRKWENDLMDKLDKSARVSGYLKSIKGY